MAHGYVENKGTKCKQTLTRVQDDTIAFYAGYTEEEVDPVAQLMVDYLARPVVHEAFFKKYASKKFLKGMSTQHHRQWPLTDLMNSFLSRSPVGQEAR